MSEYKTFSNNEYPKVGEVCIVYRTNALDESKGLVGPTESFFGKFSIEDGIPYWGAGHRCKPIDQWKLVEFEASPKTQAEPPADTEKIRFRVEDGMLVGENTNAEWCVATPVSEAYDVLVANASRFDTDPNSLEERNKRQQEVIEVQVEELTKYRAALKAKEEEREAFLKVLATKDAKITDLMVQNATLKARLNPNAEA